MYKWARDWRRLAEAFGKLGVMGDAMRQPKIVVVGAGLVGDWRRCFGSGHPERRDRHHRFGASAGRRPDTDLAHAAAFWGHNRFYAGEYENAHGADIVVITAGVGVKPGQTGRDLAKTNAGIATEIVDRIAPLAPDAIYVIATNPGDVSAGVVLDRLRCARERVISTGTSLDTGRLLSSSSERLGVVAPGIKRHVSANTANLR